MFPSAKQVMGIDYCIYVQYEYSPITLNRGKGRGGTVLHLELELAYFVNAVYVQLPFLLPPLSVCRHITFFAIQVDVYKK